MTFGKECDPSEDIFPLVSVSTAWQLSVRVIHIFVVLISKPLSIRFIVEF
jgi:hypothetical protein